MMKSKRGFTLIEVLVVVLIVAVLAAVAMPMYKRAVLKSRYSALMPIGNAIANSNEVHYLENGEYASSQAELSVEHVNESSTGTAVRMVNGEDLNYVSVSNETDVPNARYVVYQKHSNKLADATVCEAADEQSIELCKGLGGTQTSPATQSGWTAYLLSGSDSGTPSACTLGTGTFLEGQQVGDSNLVCTTTCENGDCTTELTGERPASYEECVADTAYACVGKTVIMNKRLRKVGKCTANVENGCAGNQFIGSNACYGNATNGCTGNEFGNENGLLGTCRPTVEGGCTGNVFTNGGGYCYATTVENGCTGNVFQGGTCSAETANGCANNTFTGAWSECAALAVGACTGSTFESGAYCRANVTGGCDGVVYNSGGFCTSADGVYCPAGTPAGGSGNAYEGECWDGNGNHGAEYCS